MGPGILIIGAWITFFLLFVVALIAVIATKRRSRAPLIATVALAALLILELWAISGTHFVPDIADPEPSVASVSS
jgi:uncharacterized membrane protein YoaK (UPF0700 family)